MSRLFLGSFNVAGIMKRDLDQEMVDLGFVCCSVKDGLKAFGILLVIYGVPLALAGVYELLRRH